MAPLAAAMMIGTAGPALAQSLDVPFVPTPQDVVTEILEMAAVSAEDIVYDLGSGDGRIVIAAVKNFNAQKRVGVDLDPARVAESEQNAKEAGVEDKVTFVQGNVFDFNFSEATVLRCTCCHASILKCVRAFRLNSSPARDWEPIETASVDGRSVYKWIVPADVAGAWQWTDGERQFKAQFEQNLETVTGRLSIDGREVPIRNARVQGRQLNFEVMMPQGKSAAQPVRFETTVTGDGTLDGRVAEGGKFEASRAV
ncbi:MAG: class I SAM-dependent methyltransferase [Proteobacteria bacterium]|nr:class I SAM-dependent methyltransferase [Pseudomonadota bacterium]